MTLSSRAAEQTKKVCDVLVQGGLLRPEQTGVVVEYASRASERAEEVILELGLATEADLLRVIATHYRTRFVTAAKLAKAEIERSTLELVPRRFAEMAGVLPVLYDTQTFTLTFLTADPGDDDLLSKVKLASSARAVKPLVARPAAIRAAVAKAYGGDVNAFAFLERQAQLQMQAFPFERNAIDLTLAPPAQERGAEKSANERSALDQDRPALDVASAERVVADTRERVSAERSPPERGPAATAARPQGFRGAEPAGVRPSAQDLARVEAPRVEAPRVEPTPVPRDLVLEAPPGLRFEAPRSPAPDTRPPTRGAPEPVPRAAGPLPTSRPELDTKIDTGLPPPPDLVFGGPSRATRAPAPSRTVPPAARPTLSPSLGAPSPLPAPAPLPAGTASSVPLAPPAPVVAAGGAPKDVYTLDDILELLRVFVGVAESNRPELRGHSTLVARLVRRLAERVGLAPGETQTCVLAAYLHDLAKGGALHLTALTVAEYEGHRVAAQKAFAVPARMLEGLRIPKDAIEATRAMYERFDGRGLPSGLSGKSIPVGARALAIVDTYADLTQSARNPYRKKLSAEEACDVLAKYRGTIFDPQLTDVFRAVVAGDGLKARLLSSRYAALVVDPDPEETAVLDMRLVEQGFSVRTVRTAEQALASLAAEDVDLVVSELELPGTDGLSLLKMARSMPRGADVPWVVHTKRPGVAEAQKAFALGVLDFVTKPAPTEVFVAKLRALLEQRSAKAESARGVSGTLAEMALPDIVQILSQGRKTGSLRIRRGGEAGEIHLSEGDVVHARWGELRGEDAFFAMLRLDNGDFVLDPAFRPTTRTIREPCEALLLEGMRRLDEGHV